ncbi:MAG: hypothetical protein R3C60_09445 [Parvularculaceae bacterium]
MTKIRAATAADAELLSRIGAETFTATFGHLYSAENLRKFLEKSHAIGVYRELLSDENCGVWIAEDEAGRRWATLLRARVRCQSRICLREKRRRTGAALSCKKRAGDGPWRVDAADCDGFPEGAL